MKTFVATLYVKPEKVADFERLQTELSELTHKHEPGTLVYDVIRHAEKANTYIVYSRFKDEAAFEAHQASSFHDDLVPPIMECLSDEMDLQFYEAIA